MSTLFHELFEPQRPLDFPLSLVEKYLPSSIEAFVGLSKAKTVLQNFTRSPRPANILLEGEPGVGKTRRCPKSELLESGGAE